MLIVSPQASILTFYEIFISTQVISASMITIACQVPQLWGKEVEGKDKRKIWDKRLVRQWKELKIPWLEIIFSFRTYLSLKKGLSIPLSY